LEFSDNMKRRGEEGKEIVDAGVEAGLNNIIKDHPYFERARRGMGQYIDKDKLNGHLGVLENEISKRGRNLSGEEKASLIYNEIASYVASGEAFDGRGKEAVLEESLSEKDSRENGKVGINRVGSAFRELYHVMGKGDYAQSTPELAESIRTLKDYEFLGEALNVLYSHHLLDSRKYEAIKEEINEATREETGNFGRVYEGLIRKPKKVAAMILGILGAGVVASRLNGSITGNVVGGDGGGVVGILIGLGLLIVSGILFLGRK